MILYLFTNHKNWHFYRIIGHPFHFVELKVKTPSVRHFASFARTSAKSTINEKGQVRVLRGSYNIVRSCDFVIIFVSWEERSRVGHLVFTHFNIKSHDGFFLTAWPSVCGNPDFYKTIHLTFSDFRTKTVSELNWFRY